MDFEVAVIGAGVMGCSAAYYLAKAGRKTVLIDQFPLPHSRGSSGGHSRITRQANYSIPALSPIIEESNMEWLRIQEQVGITLFKPSPLLTVGPGDSPVSAKTLQAMEDSVRKAGLEAEVLSVDEVNKRFRTSFPPNYKAFVDASAGALLADKCNQAFRTLFVQNGGRILDNWPVVSVTPGDVVEIKGPNQEVLTAKSVVICPGAWFGPLLSTLGIKIPVWVEKIGVFYWKIRDEKTPNFTFIDIDENHMYALPAIEYPGLMKLCLHTGPKVDPNERDKQDVNEVLEVVKKYVATYFPCLDPKPSITETCLYTMTNDKSFILDRHPHHRNIVFAGGFSGSGFKIAPACGEALARMAMGLEPKLDFSGFGFRRFEQQTKSRL